MARVSAYTAITSVSGGEHIYVVQNGGSFKVAVSVLGLGHTHAPIVAQIASVSVVLESRIAATSAALATSVASAFSAIASVSVAVRANVAAVSAALATSIASHNHAITSITGTGATGLSLVQAATPIAANLVLMPIVTVSGDIALTSSHEGRFLLCTSAATNLLVNSATNFSAQGFCIVMAEGGPVTFQDAVSINRAGTDTLVLQQHGEALLRRTQVDDVYTLKGTLGTA